ncbi:PKD domain-containing protein [Psychroserpens sp. NJDZ02]|uniref:PKD domain-containing protein n=1 Tax=Psychroserpens sp. NJDZ02 TaxID=2570561 RepID=UPI0010A84400|nr:hypothetical protein [Psychroserpens sp. NJDZ02]QCE40547.1 hypothetical protein E9099_03650 [Psychroserpens sp. NJDZ02]
MKKVHYIVLAVSTLVMTFFACTKEAEFLSDFFSITETHNSIATINYKEPTSIRIIPSNMVTGDVYEFSYAVTEGDGYLRYANQNQLSQNTQHVCEDLALELEFVGTEIGLAVIAFTVTDYTGASEEILLPYNVIHNTFEWNADPEVTEVGLNQETPLSLVLNNTGVDQSVAYVSQITFVQGSGIVKLTDDTGSSTTAIEQGESYAIADGQHLYNLTLQQIGVTIIKFEGTDSNGQIKEDIVTYNVGEVDFTLSTAGDGSLVLNTQKNFATIITQDTPDPSITYNVTFTLVSGTGSGEVYLNNALVPLGVAQTVTAGNTSFQFLGTSVGNVVLLVSVVDSNGNPVPALTSQLSFIVQESNASNTDPTVVIDQGAYFDIAEDTIDSIFSATATDADGDSVTYLWTVDNADVILGTITSEEVSINTTGVAGGTTFVLTVTVSDGNGGTSNDYIVITLDETGDPSNTDPTVVIDQGDYFNIAEETTDTAFHATAADADGDTVTYLWTVDNASVLLGSTTSEDVSINTAGVAAGTTFILTVTVSDGNGGTATDFIIVTLDEVSNNPPTVSIVDDTYLVNSGVTNFAISAVGNDVDGDVLTYAWTTNSTAVVVSNPGETEANFDVSSLSAGDSFVVTVTVTDGNGGTASDTILVILEENVLPTVTIVEGQYYYIPFNEVSSAFTTVVDDPDGDVANLQYSWTSDDVNVIFEADNLQDVNVDATGVATGTIFIVTVTVTDENGGTASDYIVVVKEESSNSVALEVTGGKCTTDLVGAVWETVYVPENTLITNGVTLYSNAGLTQIYDGTGFKRIRTADGLLYNYHYRIDTTSPGVLASETECPDTTPGGCTELTINSSPPASNGGGFNGTLDFSCGEPDEVLYLNFQIVTTSGTAVFQSIDFMYPVTVQFLDPIHEWRTGRVQLDSSGNATADYMITDHTASGIYLTVTITGRDSSEPVPSSNSTVIIR